MYWYIPFCPFDLSLSRLTTWWSSPHLTTWFSFLRCVCVCVCVGGVGGAKPTPRQKPLDPISKRSCNLSSGSLRFQLKPPGHCRRPVTRQTFVKSERLKNSSFPSSNSTPISSHSGILSFLVYPLTLAVPFHDAQHAMDASRRCGIDAH